MKIQMRLFPTLGLHTVQAVCYLYIDLNQFAIYLPTYDIMLALRSDGGTEHFLSASLEEASCFLQQQERF